MREKVAIVLSAVVLLLASLHSAPAHAQTPTGTLRIEVRNGPDGGPVESATVTAGKISASTNAEGVGLLGEHLFGRLSLFINGENLTGVRQSTWDPLVRPSQNIDGRWTVDAWAPLEGRVINGGLRVHF